MNLQQHRDLPTLCTLQTLQQSGETLAENPEQNGLRRQEPKQKCIDASLLPCSPIPRGFFRLAYLRD